MAWSIVYSRNEMIIVMLYCLIIFVCSKKLLVYDQWCWSYSVTLWMLKFKYLFKDYIWHILPDWQMKHPVTRLKRASEPNVFSTWTVLKNSRLTWRKRTKKDLWLMVKNQTAAVEGEENRTWSVCVCVTVSAHLHACVCVLVYACVHLAVVVMVVIYC